MTPNEFAWIKRAIEALEDPKLSRKSREKIFKTMSQICDRAAKELANDPEL